MKTADLLAEYSAAVQQMTPEDINALIRLGVPFAAIETVCPAPNRIILDRTGELYQPHETGTPAWTFPVRCTDPQYLETIEADDPPSAVAAGLSSIWSPFGADRAVGR